MFQTKKRLLSMGKSIGSRTALNTHKHRVTYTLLLCSSFVLGACSGAETDENPVGQTNPLEQSTTNTDGLTTGTDSSTQAPITDGSLQDATGNPTSPNTSPTPTPTPDPTTEEPISNPEPIIDVVVNPDPVRDNEAITLTPLPQPSLTPTPDAADEPVPVSGPVSTVTEYFLVRDADGKLPKDTFGELTDADYELGPLAPVIVNPTGVDPTQNRAPYFEGLDNQTVYAGETLEVLLKPVDVDGKLPGMFPEFLPAGAQYIDNFNGTKTLRWTPLQPDVGIQDFTITAVDADVPQYRAQHTIRIRVLLPADQSNIENLPPGINAVRDQTVRVNDPVVIELRGTDPNGTIPTLEILNQPIGATLVPHHTQDDISVLRFVPRTTGMININVIARDAIDPTKTGETTVNIDVRPAVDFVREGSSLLSLATARDFRLGYASRKDFYYMPDGALYARTAAQEFNSVTPENSMKWGFINPLPGRFRWAAADNLVSFARVKGMEIHGHTLVWHRQLPNWIKFSAVEDREIHMREFIDRMLKRYADQVPVWDVVNEAFEEDGSYRNSVWYEAMDTKYIEIAFRQARESAPNARLLYNDYDVAWNGPKSRAMFTMLQSLKDRQVPIDGVGFQLHVWADFDLFDEVEANIQKAADMDLNVYFTELDVSMRAEHTEQQQANVYRRVLDICLKQPRCKGLTTWGFTDQYSWRRGFEPLLLDRAYQVKPAYSAMQQRLSEN